MAETKIFDNSVPIFLLHGLGAHSMTMQPIQIYLKYQGYSNIHNLSYPVDKLEFEETMTYVDELMCKLADKEEDEIILIGQSMGGVVSNNLHKKGWSIKKAIYIGSPLHGANLLNQLEAVLPTFIRNLFYKKPYDLLKSKEREEEPPHPYHAITMGWFSSDFDGCVYKEEAIMDKEHHTHLAWADHRTIFANPRLWTLVGNLLEE